MGDDDTMLSANLQQTINSDWPLQRQITYFLILYFDLAGGLKVGRSTQIADNLFFKKLFV